MWLGGRVGVCVGGWVGGCVCVCLLRVFEGVNDSRFSVLLVCCLVHLKLCQEVPSGA
jgi:hypothetical protein